MLKDVIDCYQDDALFKEAVSVLERDFHSYDEGCGEVYEEDDLADFDWSAGVTKVCILFEEFVLKTGFSGYAYDYDDNEEFLEEPRFSDLDENVAETEARVYERACEEQIEKYFAEMMLVGNGVYAQERCDDILWDVMTKASLRERYADRFVFPELNEFHHPIVDSEALDKFGDDNWMRDFCVYFSDDVAYFLMMNMNANDLRKLYEFVENYDINDIHSSNVGFVNGQIKLFDYCGCGSSTASLL